MSGLAAAPTQTPGARSGPRGCPWPGWPGFILLLNVVGWGVLVLFIAPQNYDLGEAHCWFR